MADLTHLYDWLVLLSIGLITATITAYAIGVSFLGRESRRAVQDRSRRKGDLRRRVKQLTESQKTGSLEKALQEELVSSKRMLSEIGRPVDRLSVKRAVLYPMIFFGGTISFGVVGFLYDTGVLTGGSGYESVAGVASVASLSIGLYLLGQTLLAINKVALLPPSLTAFDVKFYPGQLQSIEIPVGKLSRVEVRIRNFGQEMAESVTAWIVLPLKFDLEAGPYSVTDLGPDDGWSTPCRGAEFSITQIAAESSAILFISVRPQTTGTFSVRVIVLEKKIGTSRHSLTINVT